MSDNAIAMMEDGLQRATAAPVTAPGSTFPDLKFPTVRLKVSITVTFEIKDQERASEIEEAVGSALEELRVYGTATAHHEVI